MNKKRLEAEMKLYGDTGSSLAEYLDMSRSTLSLKINGKSDFSQKEIRSIKARYRLKAEDIDCIFFSI